MKSAIIFKAQNGEMSFNSEYHKAILKKILIENEGKLFRIQKMENPVSDEMRGYMFGAVIPFLRQIDPGAWESLKDEQVYEVLKKNFNYFEAWNPLTKRTERYGQSAMNTSCKNVKAMEFIMRIGSWVTENYDQTLPDPEEYKRWRDGAPLRNE